MCKDVKCEYCHHSVCDCYVVDLSKTGSPARIVYNVVGDLISINPSLMEVLLYYDSKPDNFRGFNASEIRFLGPNPRMG